MGLSYSTSVPVAATVPAEAKDAAPDRKQDDPEHLAAKTALQIISTQLVTAVTTKFLATATKALGEIDTNIDFLTEVAKKTKREKFITLVAAAKVATDKLIAEINGIQATDLPKFQKESLYPKFGLLSDLVDEAERIPKKN